jgi:oligoribonuclease
MLDVSSIKIATSAWYGDKGIPPAKKNTHDALDDIRESIAEMKFYRDNLMGPKAS